MPELPEVEVLRRSLAPHLVGDRVASVEVRHRGLRETVRPGELRRRTEGRKVLAVRRRAKYLLVDLEAGSTLVVHLGMSGRLRLVEPAAPEEPHEHLVFFLQSGRELRFRDPRRFGLVFAADSARLDRDRHFRDLGVEPLEEGFGRDSLQQAARRRRGPVKTFLMDARVVVGVGNIYASEALHRARLSPRRSVARVSSESWGRLAEAVRWVLDGAIREGGTTLNDFVDAEGRDGEFQGSLQVYGRQGERCRRGDGTVRRFVQGGRSTFYCPGCQR